jgi:restriction endonuclease S subunit
MNLGEQAAKNAQPIITGAFLANQALPLPPESDQGEIVSCLDTQTGKIDALFLPVSRRTPHWTFPRRPLILILEGPIASFIRYTSFA